MDWTGDPKPGTKFKCRRNGTRHVLDRTLGGDVIFFQGDQRNRWRKQCTLAEWNEYLKTAKRIW